MRPLARGKARKAVGVHDLAFAVPSCRKQRALPAHRREERIVECHRQIEDPCSTVKRDVCGHKVLLNRDDPSSSVSPRCTWPDVRCLSMLHSGEFTVTLLYGIVTAS